MRGGVDFERARSRTVGGMTALSIAEAARQTGVTAHTLRYYERAGLLEPVGRVGTRRRFEDDDLARVAFLRCLRGTGMPIRQMRQYVELVRQGPDTNAARLAMLQEHRESVLVRLHLLQQELAIIEKKIDNYEGATR